MFSKNEELEFQPEYGTTLQQHAVRTFSWMALGLLVTAAVSFVMYSSNIYLSLYSSFRYLPIVMMFAQIGVVVAISARIKKISATNAKVLFLVYSALTGVTLAGIAYIYLPGTIVMAFGVTAVFFTSLVIIGYTTKVNLLRFGSILYAGLFSFIICQFLMMLFGVDTNSMIFAGIGLLLFTGLTAYDAQKMKAIFAQYQGDEVMLKKLSIYSALELYLDFINIFLYILRILGNRD